MRKWSTDGGQGDLGGDRLLNLVGREMFVLRNSTHALASALNLTNIFQFFTVIIYECAEEFWCFARAFETS